MSAVVDDPIPLRFDSADGLRHGIELARSADHRQTGTLVVDTTGSDDLDPFVVAAVIAQATDVIGIAVAVPVPQWQPYPTARRLAEIDKLSAGRVVWGPVDSDPRRAAEMVQVVSSLLTSWRPGALVNDRVTGRHADPARIVPVTASGRYFTIDSPLDVPAGPQGVVPVVDFADSIRGGGG